MIVPIAGIAVITVEPLCLLMVGWHIAHVCWQVLVLVQIVSIFVPYCHNPVGFIVLG
jgi:hypothetical protein